MDVELFNRGGVKIGVKNPITESVRKCCFPNFHWKSTWGRGLACSPPRKVKCPQIYVKNKYGQFMISLVSKNLILVADNDSADNDIADNDIADNDS